MLICGENCETLLVSVFISTVLVCADTNTPSKVSPVVGTNWQLWTTDQAMISCHHHQKWTLLHVTIQRKGRLMSLKTYFLIFSLLSWFPFVSPCIPSGWHKWGKRGCNSCTLCLPVPSLQPQFSFPSFFSAILQASTTGRLTFPPFLITWLPHWFTHLYLLISPVVTWASPSISPLASHPLISHLPYTSSFPLFHASSLSQVAISYMPCSLVTVFCSVPLFLRLVTCLFWTIACLILLPPVSDRFSCLDCLSGSHPHPSSSCTSLCFYSLHFLIHHFHKMWLFVHFSAFSAQITV